jgi:hypothetical protein
MEQGFNLTQIGRDLLSNVPVWFFLWMIFRDWTAGNKNKSEKMENTISSMNEKLNRIEVRLAGSGLDHLQSDVSELKQKVIKLESTVSNLCKRVEMKHDS